MARLMGGIRRTSIEIVHEILFLCRDRGSKKTTVMYRCNLSHTQLIRYLTYLHAQDLIEKNEDGYIRLTSEGQQVLGQLQEVIDLLYRLQELEAEDGENGKEEEKRAAEYEL